MAKTRSTVASKAAEIRKALKAIGYTNKHVSVRSEQFSMGSAIRVKILRDGVSLADVERIAHQAEKVSRCEMTGEILSGGNRYVTVDVSKSAFGVYERAYEPRVRALEVGEEVQCGAVSIARDARSAYRVAHPDGHRNHYVDHWGFETALRIAAIFTAVGPNLEQARRAGAVAA